MQSLFHKCRWLPDNTRELECMVWDAMQKFLYTDLSDFKERRQSFVTPFTADIRNWLRVLRDIVDIVLRVPFILSSVLFLESATENYSLK